MTSPLGPAPPTDFVPPRAWILQRYWLVAWIIAGLALPIMLLEGGRSDLWAGAVYAALTLTAWMIARARASVGVLVHLIGLFPYWTWYVQLIGGIPRHLAIGVAGHLALLIIPVLTLVSLWSWRGALAAAAAGVGCIAAVWHDGTDVLLATFMLAFALIIGDVFRRLVHRLDQTASSMAQTMGRLDVLQRVVARANEASTVQEVLQTALQEVCKHLQWCFGHAWLESEAGSGEFRSAAIWCGQSTDEARAFRTRFVSLAESDGDELIEAIARTRAAVVLPTSEDRWTSARAAAARQAGLQIVVAAPVLASGRIVGILEFLSRDAGSEVEPLLHLLGELAPQLAVVFERQSAEAALLQSTQDYRALFENAHDPIVIFEPEGETILEANPHACEVYGFPRDEFVGMSLAAISDDVMRGRSGIRETLRRGSVHHFETSQRRKDGTRLILEVNASVIEYRGRQAILSINRDMTERSQLEAQFLQAQKMEAMGRLAGGLAHDFNNMVAVIIGYADVLRRRAGHDELLLSGLAEMKSAGERGALLARQLLTFSRKEHLRLQPLSLGQVVQGMHKLLLRALGDRVELVLSLQDDPWPALLDRSQIEQLLMNLIINARDAMPAGGTVEIATRNLVDQPSGAPASVELMVRDTGEGMDEATRELIFEPFFTTKERDAGTGLGLASVYGIVKRHDATIDVQSELGQGTTFRIVFPRSSDEALQEASREESLELPAQSGTILVVEDDGAVRRMVELALQGVGYDVIVAADGMEAQRLLRSRASSADLVLTDVSMPRMGGIELVRALRESAHAVPIVLMTAYGESEGVAEAVRSLGVRMIEKPFVVQDLLAQVAEALSATPPTSR